MRRSKRGRRGARLKRFQQEINVAEEVLARGTAPPKWFLRIELRADEAGRVGHSFSTGIDVKRLGKARRLGTRS